MMATGGNTDAIPPRYFGRAPDSMNRQSANAPCPQDIGERDAVNASTDIPACSKREVIDPLMKSAAP